MELERRIKTCRKNLQILESRLDSIPFLKTTRPPKVNVTVTISSTTNENNTSQETSLITAQHVKEESELSEEPKQEVTTEQDPRLTKYYKMLKVGVPLEAVKIKMVSEDLDPQLLVL